jgi:hypothetical protein
MADNQPAGLAHGLAHDRCRDPRGGGGEQGVRRGAGLDRRPQLLFDLGPFGAVLLDDVGSGDGAGHLRVEPQRIGAVGEVVHRQPQLRKARGDLTQADADTLGDVRQRVADRHLQPVRQEQCRPGDADDAAADHGRAMVAGPTADAHVMPPPAR